MSFEDYNKARIYDYGARVQLADLLAQGSKISYGIVQPGQHDENGVPIVRVNNLKNGTIDTSEVLKVSSKVEEKYKRTRLNGGEVLVSLVGSLGRSAIVPESLRGWNIARAVAVIPVNDDVGAKWIRYCLCSPESQFFISSRATTTVQATFNLSDLAKLPVPLPNKVIRNSIVSILSSLDDKIELNNAINKNLEEIAQALFKRWFIDFEFPNEKGEPYKSSGGEFVESESGLIPKGWGVDSLDSIANYLNGLAMQKYRPDSDHYIPVIKIRELNLGRTNSDSDKASPNIDSKYIVQDGDVIFSWSGTLEVKLWCGGLGGLNQHLFKVTSENYEKWFYYYWTLFYVERFRNIAKDKATTMGHIKRQDLKNAKVFIPTKRIYELANQIFKPIIEQLIVNEVENLRLEKLRDALLPKLMSGEIRVPINEQELTSINE